MELANSFHARGGECAPVMWLFTVKQGLADMIERYKARLVALGNLQKPGRDFFESYAPVVNELTFRVFLSICVQLGFLIHQIDIKTAFLNADIEGDFVCEIFSNVDFCMAWLRVCKATTSKFFGLLGELKIKNFLSLKFRIFMGFLHRKEN